MPLTPHSFREWVRDADPGDRICYHTGHLCRDRGKDVNAHELGLAAMEAGEAGFVELFQTRHAAHQYSYWARRTQEISE